MGCRARLEVSGRGKERDSMGDLKRRSVLVGFAGVAGAAIAGCSAEPPVSSPTVTPSETSTPAPSPTQTTPTPEPSPTPTVDTTPRWPLTGRPFKEGEEKQAARSAVAVKVKLGQKTASPVRTPQAINGRIRASVPLPQPKACVAWPKAARSASN